MKGQIKEKIAQGFRCLKMKIGAIDFESENAITKYQPNNNFSLEKTSFSFRRDGHFFPKKSIQ